jgi:hypothetical protein
MDQWLGSVFCGVCCVELEAVIAACVLRLAFFIFSAMLFLWCLAFLLEAVVLHQL